MSTTSRNLDVGLMERDDPGVVDVGSGILAGEPQATELGSEDDLFGFRALTATSRAVDHPAPH